MGAEVVGSEVGELVGFVVSGALNPTADKLATASASVELEGAAVGAGV